MAHKGVLGVSGLMRALATLPPRWIQEPSVVRDRDVRPPKGTFCVCRGSALLGDGQLSYLPYSFWR